MISPHCARLKFVELHELRGQSIKNMIEASSMPYSIIEILLQAFVVCTIMSVRLWVLKCKIFAQESTCSKEIVSKEPCDELWFVKKCRNCTLHVNFFTSKIDGIFSKKKLFQNINLGDHFLEKTFF